MADPAAPMPKKSDLGVRTVSAAVMLAVAGAALWLGGWVWTAFVAAVGIGVLWEWWGLVRRITSGVWARALWLIGGVVYVGLACWSLVTMEAPGALLPVAIVIGTDVGAYFAGRAIGGPRIAPSISPSKTWAGLGGGILGAILVLYIIVSAALLLPHDFDIPAIYVLALSLVAATLAVIAQAGDFFESWMKRRAGVKDSGNLIPGHGGLFDRVDGLLPVATVVASLLHALMLQDPLR